MLYLEHNYYCGVTIEDFQYDPDCCENYFSASRHVYSDNQRYWQKPDKKHFDSWREGKLKLYTEDFYIRFLTPEIFT